MHDSRSCVSPTVQPWDGVFYFSCVSWACSWVWDSVSWIIDIFKLEAILIDMSCVLVSGNEWWLSACWTGKVQPYFHNIPFGRYVVFNFRLTESVTTPTVHDLTFGYGTCVWNTSRGQFYSVVRLLFNRRGLRLNILTLFISPFVIVIVRVGVIPLGIIVLNNNPSFEERWNFNLVEGIEPPTIKWITTEDCASEVESSAARAAFRAVVW